LFSLVWNHGFIASTSGSDRARRTPWRVTTGATVDRPVAQAKVSETTN
jgi:hypothetical protein